MKISPEKKQLFIKVSVAILEVSAFLLLAYLVFLPFYPALKYNVGFKDNLKAGEAQNEQTVVAKTAEIKNRLPQNEFDTSPNRVIITKIGVNAPIVEAKNAEYGLSKGSWHVPESSTPDRGGNTVITGHRFKYLPPHNMTFYLFHKIEVGDIVSVVWKEKDYYYRVKETKIIDPTDLSILKPTVKPTLTMFTCHPIYSTDKRLVIVSELIDNRDEIENK
jgi:LPXTG-site transpeptidase (sortase) family protein